MSVIKDALPCILPVLTDIVNRFLLSSVFPVAWKISEVIPLPKDGDHEVSNNNRPVSLLPAASKICERVALNQLMTYMTTKRRLSEHQSGNNRGIQDVYKTWTGVHGPPDGPGPWTTP